MAPAVVYQADSQEGVAKDGVSCLTLGHADADEEVDAEGRIGIVARRVEIESLAVIPERLTGSQCLESGVGRLPGVVESFVQVFRFGRIEPMAGQFADADARAPSAQVFESLSHLAMDTGLTGRTQVPVEGVLNEGVGEAVTSGRRG